MLCCSGFVILGLSMLICVLNGFVIVICVCTMFSGLVVGI